VLGVMESTMFALSLRVPFFAPLWFVSQCLVAASFLVHISWSCAVAVASGLGCMRPAERRASRRRSRTKRGGGRVDEDDEEQGLLSSSEYG